MYESHGKVTAAQAKPHRRAAGKAGMLVPAVVIGLIRKTVAWALLFVAFSVAYYNVLLLLLLP